jgi:hypothetical protein
VVTYKNILRTGILMSGLMLAGSTAAPVVAQTNVDQGTTHRDNDGFDNWGLLGLVGLAGLLGRKKERDVVRTNTARV